MLVNGISLIITQERNMKKFTILELCLYNTYFCVAFVDTDQLDGGD